MRVGGGAVASQRATSASKARANASSLSRSSVSPAAMAWPPKLADELGVARGDRIEHIADVHARDRACRAAQGGIIGQRKGNHRAAQPVLDAAGDQAHHALVPALIEQAPRRCARAPRAAGRAGERTAACASVCIFASMLAALLVQLIQARGQRRASSASSVEQAVDADAHVIDAAGGIQARGHPEGEVRGGEVRLGACRAAPAAHGCPARSVRRGCAAVPGDQHAVVGIERHDIGDRAQCHQVEKLARCRRRPAGQPVLIEPARSAAMT